MAFFRARRDFLRQVENSWTGFFRDRWWYKRHVSSCPQGFRSNTPYEKRNAASQIVAALKRCSKMRDLEGGKKLHKDAISAGLHTNNYVAATLITMYSKCRNMRLARQVFDGMTHRDAVMWSSLILGYVRNGESAVAMDLWTIMDCSPNSGTYVAALKACGGLASEKESKRQFCLEKGMAIHRQVEDSGLCSDIFVASSLVDMYSKCGNMDTAREVFDRMVSKDVVIWNALIMGYVQNGQNSTAIDLFTRMNCKADAFTYAPVLKACTSLVSDEESEKEFCLQLGIAIQKQAEDRGYLSDIFVANTLMDLYGKCGSMHRAREIFEKMASKDVVTWTTLMLGYVQNGESSVAMHLFNIMDQEPSSFTYVAALKACAGLAVERESEQQFYLERGIAIHNRVRDRGYESNVFVASTLVDMYSKCRSMHRAREVFDGMISKDVVTWTSLMLGYVQNGENLIAMDLFSRMECEPDSFAYVAAVKACESLAALSGGQHIHARVCKQGLEQDRLVINTLMDFYGKCGSISRAEEMFNNIRSPDVVSWNSLITGYGSVGDLSQVFSLANNMENAGHQLSDITFISILTACSHAGVVDEGKKHFDSMLRHGIAPTVEHYNCMVNLLGRANRLQEALALVNSMPFKANEVTWMALLGACRKWKNLEVGKVAFDALVAAGTTDSAAYVLMSDIYKSLNMLQDLEQMHAAEGTLRPPALME